MLKIAITGGIASGKSTVSNLISEFGFKVFDSDKIYTELLEDESVVLDISDLINVKCLYVGNKAVLDRKAVSSKVFSDSNLLAKLNSYTHRLVYKRIDEISLAFKNEDFLFFEVPLLFESGMDNTFDKVIVVMRDRLSRIKSAVERSGLTEDEVLLRMKNQIDYDNFDFKKHTLIYNNGNIEELAYNVKNVIESFKK